MYLILCRVCQNMQKEENFTYFSPGKTCKCKFDWVWLWNLIPVQRMVKFTSTCILAYTCFHIELRAQHEKSTWCQHVELGTQFKECTHFTVCYLKVTVWSVSIGVLKETHLLLSLKLIIRLFCLQRQSIAYIKAYHLFS